VSVDINAAWHIAFASKPAPTGFQQPLDHHPNGRLLR